MPLPPGITNASSEKLLERLRQSPSLARYTRAFHQATGLSLWLVGQDPAHSCEAQNPFCMAITKNANACEACEHAHGQLLAKDGVEVTTVKCFANLRETAVPIWFGKLLVGHLRTGQVFASLPTEANFQNTLAILREEPDFRESSVAQLRQSYFAGLVVTDEHYGAIVDLLVLFATHLAGELERQPLASVPSLPESIQKVCQHLRATFDVPFSLEAVAQIAHISAHHLCTVFKASTGVTLTEFQNRERILQAKKRLVSRYARVSEVALDVGFGSLSQFNRCFQKYAGESPTEFRLRSIPKSQHRRPSRPTGVQRGPMSA
jgi:AraC-like DNA-binding protein/ligand-binding sensor protein